MRRLMKTCKSATNKLLQKRQKKGAGSPKPWDHGKRSKFDTLITMKKIGILICLYVIKLSCETLLCPIMGTKDPNWITNVSKMPAQNTLLVLIGGPRRQTGSQMCPKRRPKTKNYSVYVFKTCILQNCLLLHQ